MRIHGFDQPNLLASPPPLDLLFAGDCGIGINEALVENESREIVATGESWHEFIFVLKHTTGQVSGNARIQNVQTRPVRHDVNMEALRLSHDCLLVGASFVTALPPECVIPKLGAFSSRARDFAWSIFAHCEMPCL